MILSILSFKVYSLTFNEVSTWSVKNNGKIGNYSEKRKFLASPNYRFFLRNYRMKKLSFLFFRSFGYAELKVPFFPLFLLNPLNP